MTVMSSGTPAKGRDVLLSDGSTACIRPATTADIPALKALHSRLSEETVRLSYFGAHTDLTPTNCRGSSRSKARTIWLWWPSGRPSSSA